MKHPCPPVTMFFSSGCITLLLYVLKASPAATAIPSPLSMSDISLAAAPLQLPDNSTQSSNNNKTQEQQESLQLLYSNHTLARYVEISKAGP